ncbi:cellobiohydrolase precursor [Sclerotinia borealis F-4128]|uniref:Glucanase n=1 Tax=Sclerotinia borealis (strain F-4128) TaxID=1432307 RepID=W9CRM5_SCLBF|nr:cellobiohydrolase precursor [Sclerotinia borealis F-4128]
MASRIALLSFFAAVYGQQKGTYQTETHFTLTWQSCTAKGSCTTNSGGVVLDGNWRWTHGIGTSTNCYTGNTWDATLCPNDATCATNCALDGADYSGTYGITSSGSSLRLYFVTQSAQKNVGSRVYLLADNTHYKTFNLLNQEFTFDVDVSHLPCGLNGAVYFANLPADGGISSTNTAGAKYDTGSASNNANTGVANSISTAVTPHSCDTVTQTTCTGDACGGTYSASRYAGTCDPNGCDFNSYRMGNKTFYGPGLTVNTNAVFTVVTRFLTSTSTFNQIKRFYVQNGKVIPNSYSSISGVTGNSITTPFCTAQKPAFGDNTSFFKHGGLASMSAAFKSGMVLVLSIWDDYYANMLWLDSTYPVGSTAVGGPSGSCGTRSGVPADVEGSAAGAYVVYSNIKVGAINATYG